jgi:hypothetical protein
MQGNSLKLPSGEADRGKAEKRGKNNNVNNMEERIMTVNDYAEKVVNDFITNITDYVFEVVKHNEKAMCEYVHMIEAFSKNRVNRAIGKKVREMLDLKNNGITKKQDKRIIKSYTRHKVK